MQLGILTNCNMILMQRSDGGGVFDAVDRMNGATLCGCSTVTACQVCLYYLFWHSVFFMNLFFSPSKSVFKILYPESYSFQLDQCILEVTKYLICSKLKAPLVLNFRFSSRILILYQRCYLNILLVFWQIASDM
jgi:hypothetical protein